jgi:hypothetical protein
VSEVRKASGIDTRAVRRFREKLCRVAVYSVDGKSKCESIGSKKKKKKKGSMSNILSRGMNEKEERRLRDKQELEQSSKDNAERVRAHVLFHNLHLDELR